MVRIAAISPAAAVAIVPSDHYVADERRFMAHVASGFASLDRHPELVVLPGVEPDSAETEYGWIEPGEPLNKSRSHESVCIPGAQGRHVDGESS